MDEVKILEVGPRDGLQNEALVLGVETRSEFIRKLVDCGIKSLEAGSFVSPTAVPAMRDSELVFAAVSDVGAELSFLVPNKKGLERAVQAGVKSVAVFTATSETFTAKNIRMSVEESLQLYRSMIPGAIAAGLQVRGYISTVFGCPYEGVQKQERAIEIADSLFDLGCYEVSIGDTIGVAHPQEVGRFWELAKRSLPIEQMAGHFHDTRGAALANILVSMDKGVRSFDSSVGGLGGCPYAAGASGNVATEEVVWLLEGLGFRTGISVTKLLEVGAWIEQKLKRELKSKLYQASPKRLYYREEEL